MARDFTRLCFFLLLLSWKVFQVGTEIFLHITQSAFSPPSFHLCTSAEIQEPSHINTQEDRSFRKPPGDTKRQQHSAGGTSVGPLQSETLRVPRGSQAICTVTAKPKRDFAPVVGIPNLKTPHHHHHLSPHRPVLLLACFQQMHCSCALLH